MEETGHRNGEMVREICIFAEQHDREQERQGCEEEVPAGFNDIEANKLLSSSHTVKGGSCPLSSAIN